MLRREIATISSVEPVKFYKKNYHKYNYNIREIEKKKFQVTVSANGSFYYTFYILWLVFLIVCFLSYGRRTI